MKKVIIIGTAETMEDTPWNQEGVTYWACSPVITYPQCQAQRIDAVFEMHSDKFWRKTIDLMRDYNKVHPETIFYMHEEYPEVKNSKKYPLAEIQKMATIGENDYLARYFTSSLSYMVAMAIYMKFDMIEFYGVHMAAEEERYSMQRSCCEAWLSFGQARGVNYWLPYESEIMKNSHLYGYEQEKSTYLNLLTYREGYIEAEKQLEAQLKEIEKKLLMQKGAVICLGQIAKNMRNGELDISRIYQKYNIQGVDNGSK